MLRICLALTLAFLFGASSLRAEAEQAAPVIVFAAASLKDALDAVGAAFTAETGREIKASYAGSMALARQIAAGAPADVFFSADEESMAWLAGKGFIREDSRVDLLGNALVAVAPRAAPFDSLPLTPEGMERALGDGRIATGDPASVPVGKYASAALQKLGLWAWAAPRLAAADNARAALMFVARGEAPLGIVYLTDAISEPRVKVVATFPPSSHPPITYPAALTAKAGRDTPGQFLAFLRGKAARAIFAGKGFALRREQE